MSKKKVPDIRFIGFDYEWVNLELRKMAEFNPKAELPDTFEYVDLESVVGTEMITHRQETKNTAPSRAQRLARQGDLFFQTVRPYQKNNYLFDKCYENYVFSTGYAQIRPEGNGYFLLSLVQNNWFVKTVLDNCTGTSYPAINSTILADIKVSIPDNAEQSRIGSYFQHLDKLINLYQKKYDKLAALKKAMLERMFPKDGFDVPEIRFKGFTGKWQVRELGKVADLLTGYPFESKKFVDDGVFLARGMNVKRGYLDVSKEISEYWPSSIGLEGYLLKENDILIQMDGALIGKSYAKIELANLPALLVQRVTRIRSGKVSCEFIYPCLERDFLNYIQANKTETAVPHLSLTDIRNFQIAVTSPEEQTKIGNYFQNLDKLISLHQKELDKLKNMKKAFLEKMFVK